MRRVLNNQGFTLIELIIVIIILGVLSGIAAPRMFSSVEKARVNTTVSNVLAVERAAIQYYTENLIMPTQLQLEGVMNKTLNEMKLTYGVAATNTLTVTVQSAGANSAGVGTTNAKIVGAGKLNVANFTTPTGLTYRITAN